MTNREVKLILESVIEKTKKSVENEKNYLRELTDDRHLLMYIEELQSENQPLPEDCGYESYTDWKTQIEKEIKTSENSLSRIGTEKAELVAFEYFTANAPDGV